MQKKQTEPPKFLQKSRSLLDITYKFASGPNRYKSKFGMVLELVFRKDYFTLQTILTLADISEKDPMQEVVFAGSVLDLSRRVFEDMIYMEYIAVKGKEKYSKQFFDFIKVEKKNSADYLVSVGSKIDPEVIKKIEEEYTKVSSNLKNGRNNWAGQNVDQVIDLLVASNKVSESEKGTILMLYQAGNRKNHTSPSDVENYLNQETSELSAKQDMDLGLMIAHGALNRIGLYMSEETYADDETTKNLIKSWESINDEK